MKADYIIGTATHTLRWKLIKGEMATFLDTTGGIECVEGLFVDFDNETLNFPNGTERILQLMTELKHGLRVQISAFTMFPFGQTPEQSRN